MPCTSVPHTTGVGSVRSRHDFPTTFQSQFLRVSHAVWVSAAGHCDVGTDEGALVEGELVVSKPVEGERDVGAGEGALVEGELVVGELVEGALVVGKAVVGFTVGFVVESCGAPQVRGARTWNRGVLLKAAEERTAVEHALLHATTLRHTYRRSVRGRGSMLGASRV